MRVWSTTFAIVLAAGSLLTTSQAYLIDTDSCKEDDVDFVRGMVEGAFELAQSALNAMNKVPIDATTNRFLGLIFNAQPDTSGNNVRGENLVRTAFSSTPSINGQKGILTFVNEVKDKNKVPVDDVIIYCSEERLKRRPRDPLGSLYDPFTGAAVAKHKDCVLTFAYTLAVPDKPDIITVCPWFLKYGKEKAAKVAEEENDAGNKQTLKSIVTMKSLRSRIKATVQDLRAFNWIFAPVDLLSLWDQTMLHEMMHTKAGGDKDDVGGKLEKYGWKNALKHAQNGKSQENADNYSLFAAAIAHTEQGYIIKDDGSFDQTPGAEAGQGVTNIVAAGGGH